MGINEVLAAKRSEIVRVAARHGVGNIRVFGSVARGESTETSDVDFLIEVTGKTPPWFPGGLIGDLESLLGRKVHLVMPGAIHPEMKESILRDAVPL